MTEIYEAVAPAAPLLQKQLACFIILQPILSFRLTYMLHSVWELPRWPLRTGHWGHAGAAVLRMSSNGRCCSIVWPEGRQYAVYAEGNTGEWRKVDEESGSSVAWAGASSTYAVLHQPKV